MENTGQAKMIENYYAVIMAGGEGSRLWPLSRHSRPKQMVQLGNDRTLFQVAVDRLRAVFPLERVYVVTVAEQAEKLRVQVPEIPEENYLLEPMPRGTASVVGLAAVALRKKNPQAVMAVLAADHLIQNVDYFRRLLLQGYRLAQDGYMVTLGIRPTYPATGYGYVQRGARLYGYDFVAYEEKRFKEKPDLETARRFLEQGDHDWNSGMFIWGLDRIWEAMRAFMPDLVDKLNEIQAAWDTPSQNEVLNAVWPSIRPQTIDYGIMEKADRVAVLPAADLGWNDVGSWESLFEVFSPNSDGNITLDADHLGVDTKNSLIVSDGTGRLIVTLDVEDLIVVDTDDALLVSSRKSAQRVKEVVNKLKQHESTKRFL